VMAPLRSARERYLCPSGIIGEMGFGRYAYREKTESAGYAFLARKASLVKTRFAG